MSTHVTVPYGATPPDRWQPSHPATWEEWGRRRCNEASIIGISMVGAGIISKNPPLATAGILVAFVTQLVKQAFFPSNQQLH